MLTRIVAALLFGIPLMVLPWIAPDPLMSFVGVLSIPLWWVLLFELTTQALDSTPEDDEHPSGFIILGSLWFAFTAMLVRGELTWENIQFLGKLFSTVVGIFSAGLILWGEAAQEDSVPIKPKHLALGTILMIGIPALFWWGTSFSMAHSLDTLLLSALYSLYTWGTVTLLGLLPIGVFLGVLWLGSWRTRILCAVFGLPLLFWMGCNVAAQMNLI